MLERAGLAFIRGERRGRAATDDHYRERSHSNESPAIQGQTRYPLMLEMELLEEHGRQGPLEPSLISVRRPAAGPDEREEDLGLVRV